MEIPYLTLPTNGDKLLTMIYERIDELKLELRQQKEALEHQKHLVEQGIDKLHRDVLPMSRIPTGRSDAKLERIISSLYRVCSLIEPGSKYAVTLTDLIRLDIITDTQTNFSSY